MDTCKHQTSSSQTFMSITAKCACIITWCNPFLWVPQPSICVTSPHIQQTHHQQRQPRREVIKKNEKSVCPDCSQRRNFGVGLLEKEPCELSHEVEHGWVTGRAHGSKGKWGNQEFQTIWNCRIKKARVGLQGSKFELSWSPRLLRWWGAVGGPGGSSLTSSVFLV